MEISAGVRYDISKLKILEAKALEKLSKGEESLDVNLTILRFYQFHQEFMDIEIVSRFLAKALTSLPDVHFKLYVHLLPESTQKLEPIASLILLANHLEGARFQHFWAAAETVKDLLNTIPEFYTHIRRYILSMIALTFQKISESLLVSYLCLPPEDFRTFVDKKCEEEGWKTVETAQGLIICFPTKPSSESTSLVSTGDVDFVQIVSLVKS